MSTKRARGHPRYMIGKVRSPSVNINNDDKRQHSRWTNIITEPVLMLSNLLIEIFWNTLMAVVAYFCWYYPIGLYQNAVSTHEVTSRGGLAFLFIWAFMMFTSTFTHILIAGMDSADSAGSVGNICYMLCISFCGYVPCFCHFCVPLRVYSSVLFFHGEQQC